jgi:hypothetical protein
VVGGGGAGGGGGGFGRNGHGWGLLDERVKHDPYGHGLYNPFRATPTESDATRHNQATLVADDYMGASLQ